jgi:hypothetical protein
VEKYWEKEKVMRKGQLKEGWEGQRSLRGVCEIRNKYKTILKRSENNVKRKKYHWTPYSEPNGKG